MAKALNTCTLSVQCPPEHLHVLSASVQGTGTSYSGARQGVFLCHKNRFVLQNALPPEPSLCGGSAPKSPPDLIRKNNSMNHPKKTPACSPKWDAFHFRLPDSRDQLRLIELFKRSGARTKTEYIRARILDEHFRIVTVDKSREDFVRRLTEFTAALNKIGVLYNQAVRAINAYHSSKTAVVMLRKLEGYAADIHRLQERVIALTEALRQEIDR